MVILRILMVAALLATTSAYFGTVGAATVTAAPKANAKVKTAKRSQKPAKERVCAPVEAVATGFGKANVENFAFQNLDRVINNAKDDLAAKGAKGFAVERKEVACEDYIDFGGSIGREHKCRAKAQVCGQKT